MILDGEGDGICSLYLKLSQADCGGELKSVVLEGLRYYF